MTERKKTGIKAALALLLVCLQSACTQQPLTKQYSDAPTVKASLPAAHQAPIHTATGAVGAIGIVGPGDTLSIDILGPGGTQARVTVDADSHIVVPMLGTLSVSGLTPSAIGKRIQDSLQEQGYMIDPQVAVEVLTLRSQVVSVLGKVAHPGRYPIDSRLSLLELLALAGGTNDDAGETVTLLRRATDANEQIELYVGGRQSPSQQIKDTDLQAGDIVFVPQAPQFYIYGEVGRPGAYPVEQGLNVMRALSLAGGLTPRASERRIDINQTNEQTGQTSQRRAQLTDPIQPGDVIHVNERFF